MPYVLHPITHPYTPEITHPTSVLARHIRSSEKKIISQFLFYVKINSSRMMKLVLEKKIAIFTTFFASFTILSSIFIFLPIPKTTSPLADASIESKVLSETSEEVEPVPSPNSSHLGILLLGYGGAGHDGGYLSDAIQILYMDFEKARINLISIPRDLWVKLPNGSEMKINAVVANAATKKAELIKSGAPALKKLLFKITGVQIDYFVGIDFVGFQRAIGINLDGIEVETAETLDDPWYPIQGEELNTCNMTPEEMDEAHAKYSGFELERQFTCRYKHLIFKKGIVHMEGGDALEYVRSRHGSNEGDISRGRRQQEVLAAVRKKLFTLGALDKLPGFFNEMAKQIQTDINLEIVNYLLPALKKSREFKLQTINLSTANVLSASNSNANGFILVQKEGGFRWEEVQNYIKTQLSQ